MGEPTGVSWRVELRCGHLVTFKVAPPMKGDEIWCVKCLVMSKVVRAPEEYRVRCRNCPYAASFGVARTSAEFAAMRHRRRKPTHKVAIYNGRDIIYVMGAKDEDALFPADYFPQDPPF